MIPTLNRGDRIAETIESILRNDCSCFDVTIADQSENDLTEAFLQPYLRDSRVRYVRVKTKGLAANRNAGVRHARGPLIAITDDDCTVPGTWLRDLLAAFQTDNRIGMVFGNVLAGPHQRELGFVQAYVRAEPLLARGVRDKHRAEGIGACMALRKSVWEELSGFDEALGAGSLFRSAAETDFALRVLLAGYKVYETPEVSVVHNGFRTWEESPQIIWNYLYGLGAMFAKHLKCGHCSVLKPMFHLACRWAFGTPVADLGRRPPRLLRLSAFLRGLAAGVITPVERSTGRYAAQ